ncbi:MAG: hypothetical protein GF311_10535 [Candidatus Lokiarchaeota archaeon]|nr:hypothetical protein [Candidatus Lokiarchaeota archaeon]
MRLIFEIIFLSDYNIGTGYSEGILDTPLVKDQNGIPYIPATTLSGVLRKGICDLLEFDYLSHHRKCKRSNSDGSSYCRNTKEMCPVCRILGSPASKKEWIFSSALAVNPENRLKPIISWKNKININTGTAEEHKLFNKELYGKRMRFRFNIQKERNDPHSIEEASFIIAAMRWIKNIGSNIRRGDGKCEIHLISHEPICFIDSDNHESLNSEQCFLNVFKRSWIDNVPIKDFEDITKPYLDNDNIETNGPSVKKICYLIFLTIEPFLVCNTNERGNTYESLSYIPGQTLLGALAWKTARQLDWTNEEMDQKFLNLFIKNGIKLTPLFPAKKLDKDIYPSIPIPYDFASCKLFPLTENNDHDWKFLTGEENEHNTCQVCKTKNRISPLKYVNGFISLYIQEKEAQYNRFFVKVNKNKSTHIAINLPKGITEHGSLFHYITVNPNQYFIGKIEINDWKFFSEVLKINEDKPLIELNIGKSTAKGYGLGKLFFYFPNEDQKVKGLFIGKSFESRVDHENLKKPIIMTLITDTILLDNWGRYYQRFDGRVLKKIFQIEPNIDVKIIKQFVRTRRIDGFNSLLGLPKWRERVFCAGSSVSFQFKIDDDEDLKRELIKKLKKLEKEGIGLRREEGFGEISFNHAVRTDKALSMRIRLPEPMRLKRLKKSIISRTEKRWIEYLNCKINDFADKKWLALISWLESQDLKIEQMLNLIEKFHTNDEKVKDIINNLKIDEKTNYFLKNKNLESFQGVFKKLITISKNIPEEVKDYWRMESLKLFGEKIASNLKVEDND